MYSPLKITERYIRYWMRAGNGKGHGVHSPFVFEFITRILNDRQPYGAYASIEKLRRALLRNEMMVPVKDYGAGSGTARQAFRTVAALAASAAKSPKYGQLLFRIMNYYQPRQVLELGTSLGISSAYLACGNHRSAVITCEGNPAVAAIAEANFRELGLPNIRMVTGNFDDTLPRILSDLPPVDLAFIDGNHREMPTINYFNQLLAKIAPSATLIFDDICWSAGMESAWKQIQSHPSVLLTVDLFRVGIVFFRPEFKVKQHFRIRF